MNTILRMRGAVWIVGLVMLLALAALPAPVRAAQDNWPNANWPVSGTVDYQVSLFGEGNLPVGRGRHTWSHDGHQYWMQLDVDTTGFAAMLRRLGYVQASQGSIGANGLRPARFDVTQLGKKPEAAVFDWDAERVSIRRGERERRSADLMAGDQDLLSVWHQLGHLDELPESLLVVGNKDSRRARPSRVEDGSVRVPAGTFAARHFKIRSDDGRFVIDLWLALDHAMVPVRAVLTDPKTVTLVLEATALNVPGK
ncbi:MAG: DUF3108 domain-containing protein [Azoarcus sp.]|jgi:hypothetical protein|nr:DUF3108 domain-containing protein [Azoarcus sp.]